MFSILLTNVVGMDGRWIWRAHVLPTISRCTLKNRRLRETEEAVCVKMDALCHRTQNLIEEVHQCFSRMERSLPSETHTLENEIQARIDQITSNCERLDILVNKELPDRRQNARYRVDQIKYDCRHLQASLRNVQYKRHTRDQELRDREELLSRKFAPNDQDTSIAIDQALQQNTSLQNAHRGMDEMIGSGSTILSGLRDQRGTLKGAHKRILDIANTLGMSNTVMRLIEKRAYQDKYILFGGMIVTCIVMVLVVKYLI